MGGKALKHVETRRISREEYWTLSREVYAKLTHLVDGRHVYGIPQVLMDKEDHGDIDCVVYAKGDISERIRSVFEPRELVKNGCIYSFDYQGVQIDVKTFSGVFEPSFAAEYMSFGDLGGMMSQLWKPYGFILRDTGLFYQLRDVENPTYVIADVLVTDNWPTVCNLMGLDSYHHYRGIKTQDSAFRWLIGSKMFDAEVYKIKNLNREQRKRKEVRPMYQAFLEWMDVHQDIIVSRPHDLSPNDKFIFLNRVKGEVPEFQERYLAVLDAFKNDQDWRRAFNGELVASKTGYEGRELGRFMEFVCDKVRGHDRVKIAKFNKQDYDLWFSLIWNQYKDYYELG